MSLSRDLEEKSSAFRDLYKNIGKTLENSHEERRELFLKEQKDKRAAVFDQKRNLLELFGEEDKAIHYYDVKKNRKNILFNNRLMNSQILKEIPDDLSENWMVKMCPQGQRYLVVATKGTTTCYRNNGFPVAHFKSNLPGSQKTDRERFTVLDCVYNKDTNIYFIVDVLAWNSLSLIDGEAYLRFFWLKSKFAEDPNLFEIKSGNPCRFYLVDFIVPDLSLLQDILFSLFMVNDYCGLPYEGILFYHKEGHYTRHNPLACWLPTFMVNEILHIDIDPMHLQNKPKDYKNIDDYLKNKGKKQRRRRTNDVEMEEDECGATTTTNCDNIDMEGE